MVRVPSDIPTNAPILATGSKTSSAEKVWKNGMMVLDSKASMLRAKSKVKAYLHGQTALLTMVNLRKTKLTVLGRTNGPMEAIFWVSGKTTNQTA